MELTDEHRRVLLRLRAGALAVDLGRADPAARVGKRVCIPDKPGGTTAVPAPEHRDEPGNVNVDRARQGTGRIEAVEASFGLAQGPRRVKFRGPGLTRAHVSFLLHPQ